MAIYTTIENGVVDARTVHSHQRGAMVNWLWLHGVRVGNDWPYELIRTAFMHQRGGARLAEVEIEVIRQDVTPDMEHQES